MAIDSPTQLNERFERLAGWLAIRIVKDLPQLAPIIARTLQNSGDLALRPDQHASKVLPDFVAAWLAHHEAKMGQSPEVPTDRAA